ncbi:hypothetical protein M5689_001752 [Euphorbia peplus]|nr:hypothetical protein M5689_001752 [Euphorbia peplus]
MEGSSSAAKEEKWIKHYCNLHKILLVGEGDFSFSICLANAFGSASNIVATSLDSEDEVKVKYSKGEMNLEVLKEAGCTIIHGVDVHTMKDNPSVVKHGPFDMIIFNFPHAPLLYRENHFLQIELHQRLLRGFLKNAHEMLSIHGEVHVTHKTAYPFSKWGIEALAKEVDLFKGWKDEFNIWEYPGYENKRGYANGIWTCDDSFPVGECYTFRFVKFSTIVHHLTKIELKIKFPTMY